MNKRKVKNKMYRKSVDRRGQKKVDRIENKVPTNIDVGFWISVRSLSQCDDETVNFLREIETRRADFFLPNKLHFPREVPKHIHSAIQTERFFNTWPHTFSIHFILLNNFSSKLNELSYGYVLNRKCMPAALSY